MIQLCWMPTWSCPNYGDYGAQSSKCPYCPLGLHLGRLTYGGSLGPDNGSVDPKEMVDFLVRHKEMFGAQLTLSGGEPMASPVLVSVLHGAIQHGYTWGITSNTILSKSLTKLHVAIGDFSTCRAWTASYHPLAGNSDGFFANVQYLDASGARHIYVNIVLCQETEKDIAHHVDAVVQLPIKRINLLVDMYRQTHIDLAMALVERHPGKILPVGDGKTKQGVWCRELDKFLVVSPTGIIYPCVRKCYGDIHRIGHIKDAKLTSDTVSRYCSLDCPHTCDQVKHEAN